MLVFCWKLVRCEWELNNVYFGDFYAFVDEVGGGIMFFGLSVQLSIRP